MPNWLYTDKQKAVIMRPHELRKLTQPHLCGPHQASGGQQRPVSPWVKEHGSHRK